MNCCRRALWSCWLLVAAGCVPLALPRSGTATVVDQHGRPAAGVRLSAEPSIGYLGLNTGAGPASLGSLSPVANHTSHGDLQDLVTDELGVAHTQRGMANAVTWRVRSSGEYLSVGFPWVLNSSRISSDSMDAQLVAWRLPAGETEPFMLTRKESTTLLPDQAWLPVWLVSGTGILSDEAPGSGPDLVVRGTQVRSLTVLHLRCLTGGLMPESWPPNGCAPVAGYVPDLVLCGPILHSNRDRGFIWRRDGTTPRYGRVLLQAHVSDRVPTVRWDTTFNLRGGRNLVPVERWSQPEGWPEHPDSVGPLWRDPDFQALIADQPSPRTDPAPSWPLATAVPEGLVIPPDDRSWTVLAPPEAQRP